MSSRSKINRGRERLFKLHSESKERQGVRDTLSPKEQLTILDLRLGEGTGAVKERARLARQIEESKLKISKAKQTDSGQSRGRDRGERKRSKERRRDDRDRLRGRGRER